MTRCTMTVRRRIDQSVRLWLPDQPQSVTGRVRDLGGGGIFVCLADPAPVDSHLRLRFELPEAGTVEASAVVVRVNHSDDPHDSPGMGLRFTALAASSRACLAGLLAPVPAQPAIGGIPDEEWDPVHTAAYAQHAATHGAA